jgi:hypothetical protein
MMAKSGATTGVGLSGFILSDTNGALGYTTAFVGGNIQLTADRDIVGTLTLSYAMMDEPHNATSPNADPAQNPPVTSSVPCDNSLYLNSTGGSPLQPFTAITVT